MSQLWSAGQGFHVLFVLTLSLQLFPLSLRLLAPLVHHCTRMKLIHTQGSLLPHGPMLDTQKQQIPPAPAPEHSLFPCAAAAESITIIDPALGHPAPAVRTRLREAPSLLAFPQLLLLWGLKHSTDDRADGSPDLAGSC